MKIIFILLLIIFTDKIYAKDLTDTLITLKLNYNSDKKYYEITFSQMAGVYKAEEKFVKCLQTSLDSHKSAKVTYQPMGLMISGCAN